VPATCLSLETHVSKALPQNKITDNQVRQELLLSKIA
jgi:hypothetical protein